MQLIKFKGNLKILFSWEEKFEMFKVWIQTEILQFETIFYIYWTAGSQWLF